MKPDEIGAFRNLTEDDVAGLARALAPFLRDGDVIFLQGDLGAGKTSFARALVRTLCENPDEDVPSPTFSLVQRYQADNDDSPPIWHFDLYRLDAPSEVYELGLEEALDEGILLIEWPDRLGALAPKNALEIRFEATEDVGRRNLTFLGGANWPARLADFAPDSEAETRS